jgi:hypothetical protein
MSPLAIIIHLDVFKDSSFRFIPCPKLVPMNQFNLERVEETLRHGIIPAVALFTHTAGNLILGQQRLKVVTGILAAPVGMAY